MRDVELYEAILGLTPPWAEPGSQFTALFERAVRRGLARRAVGEVKHVGVDEKAVAKGHRYLTVVADLDRGQVLYLAEGRKGESLDGSGKGLARQGEGGSRRSPWTCGSRTSSPRVGTSLGPRRRSCSTSSTS